MPFDTSEMRLTCNSQSSDSRRTRTNVSSRGKRYFVSSGNWLSSAAVRACMTAFRSQRVGEISAGQLACKLIP